MQTDSPTKNGYPNGWIPAEAGLWFLVFGDLFLFALFFGTFAYYRIQEPVIFHASQATLNLSFGLTNTLLLLTSSWFVAKAVQISRANDAHMARRWALSGMLLGIGFIVVKFFEYGEKVGAGITPATNIFFMLYYVFTGIHLIHVLIGIVALVFLRSHIAKAASPARNKVIEGCAIFWHMVDVLWVVLFAIVYLHQ